MIIEFIYNLSLLVALSIISGFVRKWYSHHSKAGLIMQGLLFGGVAIVGMLHPLIISKGIIFDGRSVVLSLVALFFGPVSGTIAGIMALVYRIYQGGSGALMGVLVIFFSVLLGSIYYEYRKINNNKLTVLRLLYFGIIVHVVMLLLAFTFPFSTAISVIKLIGLPVILLFPLATVLIGKILSDQETSSEASVIINKSEAKFKYLFENSNEVFFFISIEPPDKYRLTSVNPAFFKVTGLSSEKVIGKLITEVIPEPSLSIVLEKYKEAVNEKKFVTWEETTDYPTGRRTGVVTVGPVIDNNDECSNLIGSVHDITEYKLALKKVNESESFLKETQKIANLGSYVFDVKTGIWKSSEILDSIFGINQDFNRSVEGWISIIHPEWKQIMSDYFTKEVIGAKKSYDKEYKIVRKSDQAVRWVHGLGVLVFNKNNELIEMVGTIRDITERKNTEEGYKKLSLAVEQSPASVVITNPDGEIEYVNKRFSDVTGYSKEEVLGKNPRILKSGYQKRDFYKELWDTILSGKEWKGEFQNKKKNKELYWESALISPLVDKDGKITSFIAVKEDITDRKREQEELIKAKEEAEEMNQLKNNFLSNMSHELRTPLIGILGYAEFLSTELKDNNLAEMANIIRNSGKRLNETLNNILDISRIEYDKQKIDIKQLDLLRYLNDQVKLFKPVAGNKNLSLALETNAEKLEAYVDEELFVSIINNLLSNALKYTDKGSITIIARREDGSAVVDVKDTGIGIAEEFQEIIFEPFRQASEGYSRRFEGTGLGLTLVKKYIDLIGATISLESKPGRGSKFTLRFPVDKPVGEKLITTKW